MFQCEYWRALPDGLILEVADPSVHQLPLPEPVAEAPLQLDLGLVRLPGHERRHLLLEEVPHRGGQRRHVGRPAVVELIQMPVQLQIVVR